MIHRSILRAAPLLAAAALVACSELPSDAIQRTPLAPRGTVIPTNAFVRIDGGESFACGVTAGGQSWCWGRNSFGQLGDSTATDSWVAVATHQTVNFTGGITGGQYHNCAIETGGQAWCWGANADGRLGDSTTATIPLIPVQVHPVGAIAFSSVSAGDGHTCGLDGSGQAYCWGTNSSGQLGNNSLAFQLTPVAVQQGGATYVQIAAGKVHTCALDNGGQAYCWGYGADGALGYGFTFGDSVPAAVTQPGGVTFTSIYVGGQHSCGLTSGGAAYCWGKNSNAQLGDSTTVTRYTPVAVRMPAGVTYTDMALTGFSSCGLSSTGQAYCWGLGSSGQLGNGSIASSRLPVAVSQPAGVTFTQIRALLTSVCGLDGNGQTWCWGNNFYGQLGNNSTTNSSSPVAVVH